MEQSQSTQMGWAPRLSAREKPAGDSSTELLLATDDRGRSERDEVGSVRAILSLAWPGGLRDKPGDGREDREGEGKPYLTFVPVDAAWMLPQLFP